MLYKLMQDTALTVHMAIPTGNHALLIEKIDPPQPKRITTYVGCAMEFHSSALGKALLANFTQPVIAAFQKSPQPRYTDNTITMGAELRQQLAEIRRQGYAVDDEEQMVGYRCIGAPVFDLTGSVIAAISVAGTTDQIHGGNIGAISSQVVRCASQISSRLNVPPGSADLSKAQPPIALKPVSSLT
jgi:DNA-binding IclR family transcriptional regulator